MSQVIIIGSGPAGISASLYAVRAGHNVRVISKGSGALSKAESIENYYGFAEPVSGAELEARGIAGAKRLGIEIVTGEVFSLMPGMESGFELETSAGDFTADAVIMATGTSRNTPRIDGIADYEGRGVSHCAVCDAFLYRGKRVAVLGAGEYALREASVLEPLAAELTLLTDGADVPADTSLAADTRRIASAGGGERLEYVQLEDGERLYIDGLFVAMGSAGATELARKAGAYVTERGIEVAPDMATTVPGLYACGDCTGGLLQVSAAVSEGATAALGMIKYLRQREKGKN